MKKRTLLRKAFTLLEMVFVITILGIVAGISSEIIAKTYEGYINQKALANASLKTELAATQIANRLAYAIPGSIVARRDNADLVDISNIPNNDTYRTLQWIGYDIDGFTSQDDTKTNTLPGWSGFADLTDTARIGNNVSPIDISTPGSNLALSNTIIANLSTRGTTRTLIKAAVYFPVDDIAIHNGANSYNQAGASNGIYTINNAPKTATIRINAPANSDIKEQYKLAWTSYAIVPSAPDDFGNFTLSLHYNFQPWRDENFQEDAQVSLLLTNVSVFRFTGSRSTIRFKLCQREQVGGTTTSPIWISVCKEKVIIK